MQFFKSIWAIGISLIFAVSMYGILSDFVSKPVAVYWTFIVSTAIFVTYIISVEE